MTANPIRVMSLQTCHNHLPLAAAFAVDSAKVRDPRARAEINRLFWDPAGTQGDQLGSKDRSGRSFVQGEEGGLVPGRSVGALYWSHSLLHQPPLFLSPSTVGCFCPQGL